MVNGIDGANGYDAKTPEKFSMTTISPTPVNSPVMSGQRWYTSLSGAGDSVSSHNTWSQQERELPLATSVVPETVECSTDESAVATASVENGKDADDGDDSLVIDGDSSEAEVEAPSTETVASTSTEATVASTETTVASTSTEATVASSETTEASSEITEASTETTEASSETTEASTSTETTQESTETTEASTEASEACSDDALDNDTTTNTEACEEDSHLDVTLESDDSFADTSLDNSVDTTQLDVTTCTSPDSSDAVEAPSCGVSRDTSEVDADTSECTSGMYQYILTKKSSVLS